MINRASIEDPAQFSVLLAEAMRAFRSDSSYAAAMARSASGIRARRTVGRVRGDLRAAEAAAQTKCVAAKVRMCAVASPCGTGDCPFAAAEYATAVMPVVGRGSRRPVPSVWAEYSLEPVVRALAGRTA